MLNKLEAYPLSNKDIQNLVPGANIVLYPDLHRYRSLDDVIGVNGSAFLLFESKPNYGHWCLIHRGPYGNNTNWSSDMIEFFNPYSGYPDDCLALINKKFARESHQDKTYLSELMIRSPYRLSFNQYPFQKHSSDIKTCGRHCVSRLYMKNMSLDEYYSWMKRMEREYNVDADAIVTAATT